MVNEAIIPEDDIIVLSTDYAPRHLGEILSIRTRLEVDQKELAVLEEEVDISRAQSLHARRDQLRISCRVGQGLLAPVRRIPEDLLGYIFSLGVPELQLQEFGRFFGAPACPVQPGEPLPHDVRRRLLLVCRRWTRIMRNTPNVWTTVVINHFLPMDLLQQTFRNSRTYSLDLFLDFPWHIRPSSSTHQTSFNVLRLVRQEMSRVRCLIAYQPSYRMFHQLFPTGTTLDAPHLETFQFITSGPDINTPQTASGVIQAPNLETVDADHRTFPALEEIRLSRLRRLGFNPTFSMSASGLLEILASCPGIERVNLPRIDKWKFDGDKAVWPRGSVALFSLKELRVSLYDTYTSARFCAALRIPALDVLDVSVALEDSVVATLETLLLDSAASLRHLTVRSHPPTQPLAGVDVGPLLRRLHNVRSIHIALGDLDADFFTILTPYLSTSPTMWTCPYLTRLEFTHVNFPGDKFVDLIRARTSSDSGVSSQDKIAVLGCEGCPGLKEHHVSELMRIQDLCSQTLQISIQ